MGEAGILHEDDRVELIGGEIVEMTPIGARYASCVRELNRLLSKQVGKELRIDVQNPIRLNQRTEPQPDLAVIRARDYRESPPRPEDVPLLIEVADTSLACDCEVKLVLHARFGIPEARTVYLPTGTIGCRIEPSEDGQSHPTSAQRSAAQVGGAARLLIPVEAVFG
jgi:hypothetical protein